ncbi:MAG: hypothetical protein H0U63_00300 [Burkholderiales bacterium]|nr:hypothetical protein [Burkholderiales bacterium]
MQKICPKCQTPADIHTPACLRCGHRYRTQFAPPPLYQTQVVPPPPAFTKRQNPALLWVGGCCGVPIALSFLLAFIGLFSSPVRNAPIPPDAPTLLQTKSVRLDTTKQEVIGILGNSYSTSDEMNAMAGGQSSNTERDGLFYTTKDGGLCALGFYHGLLCWVSVTDKDGNTVWTIENKNADI